MTLEIFAIAALTILIATFVQGSTGMGFAMITAPVLGLVQPSLIPILLLVLMVPLNGYVAWRERERLDWRGLGWISVGRFAGTFIGLWILVLVTQQQLALLIGWATLVAAIAALLAPPFDPNRSGLGAVGFITGITETSTGIGGPPLALAYQHKPGPVLRSTVASCFLVGEIISLVVLLASGEFALRTLMISAALLPCVAIGSFLSKFVHHRLDGPIVRYLVLGFAIASGITILVQA